MSNKLRATAFLILLGGVYVVPRLIYREPLPEPNQIATSLRQLGFLGPLVFIAVSVLRGFLLFPPNSTMYLVGGLVFGPVYGVLYALLGALTCAAVQFAVARYLGLAAVLAILGKNRRLPDVEILSTWSSVMLVRFMIIGPPFDLVNYGLGLTKTSWANYLIGTAIGLLPSIVLFTQFGYALDVSTSKNSMIVALSITVAAVALLGWQHHRRNQVS